MKKEKLKAGLVLLAAEWFSQIDYDVTDDASANINDVVKNNAAMAVETVGRHFDVVHPDVIFSVADAKAACDDFRRENVDVIVVAHLIYSGDDPLIEVLLQMKGVPVILWSYNIYRKVPQITEMGEYFSVTGAPGMLQGVAPMKRMNVKFGFLLGVPGAENTDAAFADFAAALSVKKWLRELNIMSVGRRYEPVSGAWIDELRLKTCIGPKMVWISAWEYAQAVKAVDEELLAAFVKDQKERYEVSEKLREEDIVESARASIACYDLCKKYDCEVMSFQDMDPEVHDFVGCRPQMTYQKSFDEGIMFGMEADIDSALCVWILHNLSGQPSMYGEILTYDEADNFLVIGHAAPHDLRLAGDNPVKLIPDLEFMFADRYQGVWDEFITPPGPVTLVAMFEDNDTYRFVASAGMAMNRPVWVPGYGQSLVHTDIPIADYMKAICKAGVTQHFALCFGDVKPRLRILADELGAEMIDLDKAYAAGLI